jgi:hypothetical protein
LLHARALQAFQTLPDNALGAGDKLGCVLIHAAQYIGLPLNCQTPAAARRRLAYAPMYLA